MEKWKSGKVEKWNRGIMGYWVEKELTAEHRLGACPGDSLL